MGTRIIAIFTILAVLSFTTCQNPQSPDDLLNTVKNDVAYSKADSVTVNFSFTGDGSISPNGSQKVKKGIPFEISALPLSNYTFAGWKKGNATDKVVFENATRANTKVTISSDNANIIATFASRPELLYSVPGLSSTSNSINTGIYLYLTNKIDPASVDNTKVSLNKVAGAGAPIAIQSVTVIDKMIVIKSSGNLPANTGIQVTLKSSIKDINGASMVKDDSIVFFTGATADTTSTPNNEIVDFGTLITNSVFTINSAYAEKVPDPVVNTWVGTYNYNSGSVPVTPVASLTQYSFDPVNPISYTLPANLLEGNWSIGVHFEGSVGTKTSLSLSPKTFQDIYYDKTPPLTPSFVIANESAKGTGSYDYIGPNSFTNGSFDLTMNVTANDATNLTGTTDVTKSKVGSFVVSLAPIDGTETPTSYTGAPTARVWNMGGSGRKIDTYLQSFDLAGNKSPTLSKTYIVDVKPPTGTLTSTTTHTNGSGLTFTVNLTGSDSESGEKTTARLYIKRIGSDIVNDGSRLSFSASPTVTLNGGVEGQKTVSIELSDPVGNISTLTYNVVYDTTSPATPNFLINSGASTTSSNTVTLASFTNTVDQGTTTSPISYYLFSNDNSAYTQYSSSTTSVLWNLTAGDGPKTVYMKTKDKAGNLSGAQAVNIGVLPSGTLTLNSGATYTNSTTLTLSLSSVSPAVTGFQTSLNNSTWSSTLTGSSTSLACTAGDGVKTIYVKLINPSGTTVITDTITLDQTPPVVSLVKINGLNNSGSTIVTLNPFMTFSAYDATSGTSYFRVKRWDGVSSWVASASTTSWTNAAGTSPIARSSFAIPSDMIVQPPYSGTKYYAIVVTDQAGNTSSDSNYAQVGFGTPYIISGSFANLITSYTVTIAHASVTGAGTITYYLGYTTTNTPPANPSGISSSNYIFTTGTGAMVFSNVPIGTKYFWMRVYDSGGGGVGPWIGLQANLSLGKQIP